MRIIALFGISAFFLQACIAVPIRMAEEKPFHKDEIGQIIPGETDQREIRTLFGDPSESYRDGRWWAFHKSRRLTEWLVAVGGGYTAAVDTVGGDRRYTLLIEFDNTGIVQKSTVVADNKPCGLTSEICYGDLGLSLDLQSESTIPIAPDHCAVYLYIDRQTRVRQPVFWEVDDRVPVLKLTSAQTFHRLDIVRGMHVVEVLAFLPESFSSANEFECSSGARRYFQFRRYPDGASRVEFVDEEQARDDLRSCRLVLLPDELGKEDEGWQ